MAAVILTMTLIVAVGAAIVAFVTVPHPRRNRRLERAQDTPVVGRKRRISRSAQPQR